MSYDISEVADNPEVPTIEVLMEIFDAHFESQLEGHKKGNWAERNVPGTYGACGSGKTALFSREYVKWKIARGSKVLGKGPGELKVKVITFIGPQDAAEDIGGMWVPNHEAKKMDHYLPRKALGYFEGSEEYDIVICFWDEWANQNSAQMSSAQSYIEDGEIRGEKMAPNAVVAVAWNLPEHSSNANKMPTSMLSGRITAIPLGVDYKRWLHWAPGAGIDPRLISAIEWRPELLYSFDPKSKDYVQATPRGLVKVDKLIKQGLTGVALDVAARGLVGHHTWASIKGFFELGDELPTFDEICDDPKGCPCPGNGRGLAEQGPAAQWVITSNIAYILEEMKKEEVVLDRATSDAILTFLGRLTEEMAVWGARLCENAHPDFVKAKGWGKFQKEHAALTTTGQV